MKSRKLKIILMAAVWCGTAGAAFWFGRHSAPEQKTTAKGKILTDHGPTIVLNTVNNSKTPTTNDLLQGKGKPSADDLKAWADSLDPSQCAAMLAELEKLPGGDPRDAMINAMIASWATRDPQGYLADYTKVSNPRSRETGVTDALKAMAEKDPKAAAQWLADSKDAVPNQMLAQRYRSTIQGMAANDPQAALDFVKGLDSGSTANAFIQRQGLNSIADALASNGQFTDAVKMFASLTDPTQRATATNELMTQWAQSNPTDATAFVATLTDPAQRSQDAGQVVNSWARNDPQAAAAWAAQFEQSNADSSGQAAGQVLADAMRSWSRYDLDGPAQFLNTITPSAATDPAVATFAMQASRVDPATAMVWANQISDPTARASAEGAVAVRMLASGQTDALNKAIASNTLTPDQVQFLQQLPANNPWALNRIANRLGAAANPNGPQRGRGGFGGRGGAGGPRGGAGGGG